MSVISIANLPSIARPFERVILDSKIDNNQIKKLPPLTVTITDPQLQDNSDPTKQYLEFTVNLYVHDYKIMTIPAFILKRGRIQVPRRSEMTKRGVLWSRAVEPATAILVAVEKALEASGWLEQYSNLGPFVHVREWPLRKENIEGVQAQATVRFD